MSKTRKYQRPDKKNKKNKKNTRSRRKRQKGGVWIGSKIEISDSPITDDNLLKSEFYMPNNDDYTNFDIKNLSKSVDDLNKYFKSKQRMNSKTKKPMSGHVNLYVEEAKLSNCNSMLSAGEKSSVCLNLKYSWKVGDKHLVIYRQLGPLQYFMDKNNLELPFIAILNLLELIHTVSDVYEGDDYDIKIHRLSLLVKDLSESNFSKLEVVQPSRLFLEEPLVLDTETVKSSEISPKPRVVEGSPSSLILPEEAPIGSKTSFKRNRFTVNVSKEKI